MARRLFPRPRPAPHRPTPAPAALSRCLCVHASAALRPMSNHAALLATPPSLASALFHAALSRACFVVPPSRARIRRLRHNVTRAVSRARAFAAPVEPLARRLRLHHARACSIASCAPFYRTPARAASCVPAPRVLSSAPESSRDLGLLY
ncbi:hypothetical protein EVG20_g3678 [Dentipellis fragilis]|uniref:Uncharacterized protein n=1 Tax=Dentipellis fragilis TaxID=205917 RepID=A0A4Y9Z2S9_9AGAM|nr:hypothetical protein EVG20_g3678 [Dentipellis fragilis]